ncbi:phosphate transport system regulatory protein PhoU, partial [Priestia megaterium]
MVVREKFHGDLKILREKLLEIGRLTHEALSKSIEALQTSNVELALEII